MLFNDILEGLSADPSAGDPGIESSPSFAELKLALNGKPTQRMGDAEIPGVPANYPKALELATELLGQSKHISLLTSLCTAATGAHGFEGLAAGLNLKKEVLSNYWEVFHPAKDQEDPEDPWWERINYLREVAHDPLINGLLYNSPLVDVKHIGSYSIRDIDIAAGRKDASDEEKERCNPGLIRAAFSECDKEKLKNTDDSITAIVTDCAALDILLAEHIGEGIVSYYDLKVVVEKHRSTFREYAEEVLNEFQEQAQTEEVEQDQVVDSQSQESAKISPIQGIQANANVGKTHFTDRDAVVEAFNDVISFYNKHEPSSPVPILVFRAREMVYKNFFDILKELAPQKNQANFKELTSALKDDPLRFVLEHSYESFMKNDGAHGLETGSNENISSREQVVQTLKDIQQFFEVNEPSSPIPLIVKKVRNLVPKTFLDLLAEFEPVVEEQKPAKIVKKKAANNEEA